MGEEEVKEEEEEEEEEENEGKDEEEGKDKGRTRRLGYNVPTISLSYACNITHHQKPSFAVFN